MKLPNNIHRDSKLLSNTAAFLITTGCSMKDLLYVTFHNEVICKF